MVHTQNQHDPVPVSALVMSADQLNDLKDFLTGLIDNKSPPPAVLSDAQFDKLASLLQPGYELSSLYLAEYKRANAPIAPGQPPTAHGVPASSADLERDADLARQREANQYKSTDPRYYESDDKQPEQNPTPYEPGRQYADTFPARVEEVPASEKPFVPPAPAPAVSPRVFTPPPSDPKPFAPSPPSGGPSFE